MREVAEGVLLLRGFPPGAFNVYALRDDDDWVLVDAATRFAARRIERQLPGRLGAIFVSHAHRDHTGSIAALARRTGAPVIASAEDAPAIEGRVPEPFPAQFASHPVNRLFGVIWSWERHPVERNLAEGDEVAGFRVVAFPGHTPGQLGLWRQSDRTVLCADTMRGMSFLTGRRQLGEMPKPFTVDLAESRRSIRKLVGLEPRTVLFGHGPPLTDGTASKIAAFGAALP